MLAETNSNKASFGKMNDSYIPIVQNINLHKANIFIHNWNFYPRLRPTILREKRGSSMTVPGLGSKK